LRFVFLSLTVLFALLALRDFMGSHTVGALAGYVGLVCGASAMYLGMAEVLHEQRGHKFLPY
jgi:succinate-acetate transporter protein